MSVMGKDQQRLVEEEAIYRCNAHRVQLPERAVIPARRGSEARARVRLNSS